jgi:Holliday junction resolvase-like predicted endonuclease
MTCVSGSRLVWTDPPVACDVGTDYAITTQFRKERAGTDWPLIWTMLSKLVKAQYSDTCPEAELVEFAHGAATYLFDNAGRSQAERTVLVASRPARPPEARETAYQAGYPLPETVGGRSVDRGHFLAYSGGGLFGPNIFVQDRALNRGWSRQGRLYRALEPRAVTAASAVLFVRPHYADDSDAPALLDLGVIDDRGCEVYRFRNRYDLPIGRGEDELKVALNGATNALIGALGEETAAAFLVQACDATIVTMGDASMPRDGQVQDLDLVAILDGALVAFEVKTRFMAKSAGRRTRVGNLARPRMRRAATKTGSRQGSQDYVAARLGHIIDIDEDYAGIDVRVIAVDLRLMEIQQFAMNDSGTRLTPVDGPADCTDAARAAFAVILEHRGRL